MQGRRKQPCLSLLEGVGREEGMKKGELAGIQMQLCVNRCALLAIESPGSQLLPSPSSDSPRDPLLTLLSLKPTTSSSDSTSGIKLNKC